MKIKQLLLCIRVVYPEYLDMKTGTKLNYLVSHFAHKLDFHQS